MEASCTSSQHHVGGTYFHYVRSHWLEEAKISAELNMVFLLLKGLLSSFPSSEDQLLWQEK